MSDNSLRTIPMQPPISISQLNYVHKTTSSVVDQHASVSLMNIDKDCLKSASDGPQNSHRQIVTFQEAREAFCSTLGPNRTSALYQNIQK